MYFTEISPCVKLQKAVVILQSHHVGCFCAPRNPASSLLLTHCLQV